MGGIYGKVSHRRCIILAIVAVTICLMLVLPVAGKARTNLQIWWWSETDVPGSRQFLTESAKQYEKLHPGVTISFVEQTDSQLYPAFRAAAKAGKGPDIQFMFSGSWLLEDVWLGNLEPMENFFSAREIGHWRGQDAYRYGGKTWAFPWYTMAVVMIYNRSLFTAAGLDPAKPPETWADFMAACEKLKKAGITPFGYGVKAPWSTSWISACFLMDEFDDVNQMKLVAVEKGGFTVEKIRRSFERLYEMIGKRYVNETVMSLDYSQARDEFLRGDAAISLVSSADLVNVVKQMGEDKVWVMRFPSAGQAKLSGRLVTQTQLFTIPSFSKQKKEAAAFLKFLHTTQSLRRYYEITHSFPANGQFNPGWIKNRLDRTVYTWMDKYAGPYIDLYWPPMITEEGLYPALQRLFSGAVSPAEACKTVEEAAARWRSLNPDQVKNYNLWSKN